VVSRARLQEKWNIIDFTSREHDRQYPAGPGFRVSVVLLIQQPQLRLQSLVSVGCGVSITHQPTNRRGNHYHKIRALDLSDRPSLPVAPLVKIPLVQMCIYTHVNQEFTEVEHILFVLGGVMCV